MTAYHLCYFIIKGQQQQQQQQKLTKNNQTQYQKSEIQPRKTKLVNQNTTQDQSRNHPLARPVQNRNKLSSVPQNVVRLATRATPSEWRWM